MHKSLPQSKKIEYNLEALRGYAALFVVLSHLIMYDEYLDPHFFPKELKIFETPGHLSVLVFFVLSGFVIGISNKNRMTLRDIVPYLKKRLLRIYPIYFISLVLALLVSQTTYSLSTLISNFTLTQVLLAPYIWENNPIWSLHYEVLFYLLFIPVSYFKVNPVIVTCLAVIFGLINFFLYPNFGAPILTSYAFGFAFWCSGLILSRYFFQKEESVNYNLLFSNIFLILCLPTYNVITTGLSKFCLLVFNRPLEFGQNIEFGAKAITVTDFSFLPYCFLLVINFSNRKFLYKNHIVFLLQIIPAITFLYLLLNFDHVNLDVFKIPTIYYLLSLFLFFTRSRIVNLFSKRIIKAGIWLGGISYGIYIMHFPILVMFRQVDLLSGSVPSFVARFCIYLSLVIYISFLLEKKLQPWLNGVFKR